MNTPARILVVEDEFEQCQVLREQLQEIGYNVDTTPDPREGVSLLSMEDYDVVITDYQLPGMSGLELLNKAKEKDPYLPVIMVTGHHTSDTGIDAYQAGAFEYVLKPYYVEELLELVDRAVETKRSRDKDATKAKQACQPHADSAGTASLPESSAEVASESPLGHEPAPGVHGTELLVGRSAAMRQVYVTIGRVAKKPATVLIRGETGTGKELVARALHHHSDRNPFVAFNCGAIPEPLLESELFGHEMGAFTGAARMNVGRFEQAHGGTLFLDEIGDVGLQTQAKLLRVLDEHKIQRIGSAITMGVDVRVIAATHQNLEELVAEGRFRKDLYHRLNDAVIHLPPLRDRPEDIPQLVAYFLGDHQSVSGVRRVIVPNAIRFLQSQPWPGNVRQLRNIIHKMVNLSPTSVIDAAVARAAMEGTQILQRTNLKEYVNGLLEEAAGEKRTDVKAAVTDWMEQELYRQAYELAEGDQSRMAAWLGVSRPTARERLRQFGLKKPTESSGT